MSMFPQVLTKAELIKLTEQLKALPKTIRDNINANATKITYEGLSAKFGKEPSDLVVYKPTTNGTNFGVMFYNHDKFNDTYEVNPHKVNFSKDRETLQIGSTSYTAKIRRYVKETRMTYTLKLVKGEASPLFVPYKEDIFLVLEPIVHTAEPNPNQKPTSDYSDLDKRMKTFYDEQDEEIAKSNTEKLTEFEQRPQVESDFDDEEEVDDDPSLQSLFEIED